MPEASGLRCANRVRRSEGVSIYWVDLLVLQKDDGGSAGEGGCAIR